MSYDGNLNPGQDKRGTDKRGRNTHQTQATGESYDATNNDFLTSVPALDHLEISTFYYVVRNRSLLQPGQAVLTLQDGTKGMLELAGGGLPGPRPEFPARHVTVLTHPTGANLDGGLVEAGGDAVWMPGAEVRWESDPSNPRNPRVTLGPARQESSEAQPTIG